MSVGSVLKRAAERAATSILNVMVTLIAASCIFAWANKDIAWAWFVFAVWVSIIVTDWVSDLKEIYHDKRENDLRQQQPLGRQALDNSMQVSARGSQRGDDAQSL